MPSAMRSDRAEAIEHLRRRAEDWRSDARHERAEAQDLQGQIQRALTTASDLERRAADLDAAASALCADDASQASAGPGAAK